MKCKRFICWDCESEYDPKLKSCPFCERKEREEMQMCKCTRCGVYGEAFTECKHCTEKEERKEMREFETGATRDSDTDKLDFEGFLSPSVLLKYAEYMNKHRKQSDGKMRASDNWQKGIPFDTYMKSGWRHFMDWWTLHRIGLKLLKETPEGQKLYEAELTEAICGVIFNAMGYLHEMGGDV